jgi:hypothetical protein
MSAKKFKFVSPGVFLNEIDNSILPRAPKDVGPMVIGRSLRGPAMRPVTVDSFEEFVNIYGMPVPGGDGSDVWRNGNKLTPTYGAYAAQAWLKNSPTITFFRLAGTHHLRKANTDGDAAAGWRTTTLLTVSEASTDWTQAGSLVGTAHTRSATPGLFGTDNRGGAYGLWVFPKDITGSAYGGTAPEKMTTGSLAAIWYLDHGSAGLKGLSTHQRKGEGGLASKTFAQAEPIASDSSGNFTVVLTSSNAPAVEVSFNFDQGSDRYIRKVFNTNPALCISQKSDANNLVPSDAQEIYWLGETYANVYQNHIATTCTSSVFTDGIYTKATKPDDTNELDNDSWGIILAIVASEEDGPNFNHANQKRQFTDPKTGWFISQDLTAQSATGSFDPRDKQKLFRLCSLGHGEWVQRNLKASIQNIKAPSNDFVKHPTFDLVLRNIADTDKAQQVVEKFSNCNLNPKSIDFIANKVGTQYYEFDTAKRRLALKGAFANRSNYVRVELDSTVEAGTANEEFVPFGVFGPPKYRDFHVSSSAVGSETQVLRLSTTSSAVPTVADGEQIMAAGGPMSAQIYLENFNAQCFVTCSHTDLNYKFVFPEIRLRQHSDQDGLTDTSKVNFGVWTGEADGATNFNNDILDLVRPPSADISEIHHPAMANLHLDNQFVFTLDDIIYAGARERYEYLVNSRRGDEGVFDDLGPGSSITAEGTGWTSLLNHVSGGISSFTTVFHGGTDGWDITEKNPIRNRFHDGTTEVSNYAFNTIKQAIDSVKDPEFVEYNLITIPGITNNSLTSHLLGVTEDRADAMAIIDLEGDFQPSHEGGSTGGAVTYGTLSDVTSNLKDRGINNSYGCAYYPFVQVRDSITGDLVYMPPSVLALGAMSYTDKVKAPWFAPAGFNRGGLSSGLAGLPVVGVTDKLSSEDRDSLYDNNINPIASFPSEGIVIFGQKTLQVTRSALDRINVRRLLLFVKKGISRISNELLFEPNVQETWDRFISRANPFLADVKARFGLTDYKLVLDKTTTTPDLIDQNIMYAKVFLKPARAIEFIAVDFIITNTGASFED